MFRTKLVIFYIRRCNIVMNNLPEDDLSVKQSIVNMLVCMDIDQLREGNIIVVYPRENQEGILSIREMHQKSVICDMLSPRAGYQFRILLNEINPIRLSNDWLVKASFRQDPDEMDRWLGPDDLLPFRFLGRSGILGHVDERKVEYLHQLQNTYFELTGKKLHVSIN